MAKKKKGKGSKKKKKVIEDPKLVRDLLIAAELGDKETMIKMLEAPPQEKKYDLAQSAGEALVKACEKGNLECATMLVDAGANVDLLNGKSIQRAAMNGHLPLVKMLQEREADINAKSIFSEFAALHYAAQRGALDIVKFLVAKGADVDIRTHEENCGVHSGWTALHFAADEGQVETCRFLVEQAKATIDIPEEVDTPLSIAAEHGRWPVVHFLVTAGANIHATRRGLNVVQWACYRAHPESVQFLVSYGAKPDLDVKVLWFPPDLSLDDLLKRDLSLPIWEKIDVSIYRGSVQLRERAAHMRILSEVRWESKVARDMRSFDGPKEPEISQFPKHVIHIISACDI